MPQTILTLLYDILYYAVQSWYCCLMDWCIKMYYRSFSKACLPVCPLVCFHNIFFTTVVIKYKFSFAQIPVWPLPTDLNILTWILTMDTKIFSLEDHTLWINIKHFRIKHVERKMCVNMDFKNIFHIYYHAVCHVYSYQIGIMLSFI